MTGKAPGGVVLAAALMLLLAPASPAGAGQVLTDPIPPPGATHSEAFFIDEDGRIAGEYGDGIVWKAFLFDGSAFTDVVPPGAVSSSVAAMNNNLGIVGEYYDGAASRSYLYADGAFRDLPPPPGATGSVAAGIGDGGQVVGSAWHPAGPSPRGWYLAGDAYTEILPPGGLWSSAVDVNSSGRIVGQYFDGAGARAFLYSGGAYSDPAPPGWVETSAHTINNRGTVLGGGWNGAAFQCYMNRGGTITVIAPAGALFTECWNVSENDTVVGWSEDGYGWRPFVFRNGASHALEARDGKPFTVWDINSRYRVAGTGGGRFMRGLRAAAGGVPADTASGDPAGNGIPLRASTALRGSLLPEPMISVNKDALMWGNYAPKFSLLPWAYAGQIAEWWVISQAPSRTYSYDIAAGAWVPGFFPSRIGPLHRVPEVVLPPAERELGIYTYYFGIDFFPNGTVDGKYLVYDSKAVQHRKGRRVINRAP